jgi:hypothetical protein
MHPTRSLALAVAVLATGLGVGACGDGSDGTAATEPTSAVSGATAPAATVSANDATESEIAVALETAGVTNPGKWADEVVEYRPYPKDDPAFAKLRQKLAKYNPGRGVVDRIVSVLEP